MTIEGITKAVTFPAKMHFKDGMDGNVKDIKGPVRIKLIQT
ncbi:hypothetical protein SAMN05660293_05712 [Dyadobacter psychrophilus]|uniref:Uncharacterized protein n=1 Tax=Dyadobacter psychrophilus TaxID=651661 RepID=A0A1T5HJL3_9BACT|nr:hypothetical protein SAMN05660293_05712 [Dyadobacter psychrophilus]